MMKGKVVFLLSALLLATVFTAFLFIEYLNKSLLTSDQINIRRIFGNPSQFVVTYIERGESKTELVRNEVWFYPLAGKRIGFLAGKLAYSEDYQEQASVIPTKLKPEDFDFEQSLPDIENILGKSNIESLVGIPVFFDEDGIKTYYSPEAIFTIENNHLTYIQTVGAGDKKDVFDYETSENAKETIPTPTITSLESTPSASTWKTYTSSDLGFSVKFPPEWFLSYGVLSSYDTGYMEKNITLPEVRLKCDFGKREENSLEFTDAIKISDNPILISKGKGKELSETEGPGLGDNIMFVFDNKIHSQVQLLCFSYSDSFETKLIEMLKTFSFIE